MIPGVPLSDYVADRAEIGGVVRPPSLSASIAHILITRSAAHARFRHPRLNPAWTSKPSAASEIGTAAHAILLEGDRSRIVAVNAESWSKKDHDTDRVAWKTRDKIRVLGKLPILVGDVTTLDAMVEEAQRAVADSELGGVFHDGTAETTLLWRDGEAWCRSRPDWFTGPKWTGRRIVLDYKTTATKGEPETWAKGPLLSSGYDVQGALALRGLSLEDDQPTEVVFMVQETEPPYAVSFVGLSPASVAWAHAKREHALQKWTACLAEDRWRGYPSRIAYAEPPAWALGNWNERTTLAGDNAPEDESVEAL